ncbi:MAG: T9SS type A sorting domain-containing protein [Bacteroidales bacterium]|nr:T9SS type A sorting domain-containing protein [Bacteroidales bacterium]
MAKRWQIGVTLMLLVFQTAIGLRAQQTNPVGVSLIVVHFDQPPDQALTTVELAPLKYNKDFALSMQIDDGGLTIFTHGYPVFEGGTVGNTNFPGLAYTDGCGNPHHFKMSSVMFSFNGEGENGPDTHVDNAYGQVSWAQLNTMVQNNWGIINHGVNSNANTNPAFMNYSIKRNESYIRRQLYDATPGGFITHLHANPNGSDPWTPAAEALGYLSTYNQNQPSPLGDRGGNVNNVGVDWTDFQNIYRIDAGPTNIQQLVTGLADSSNNGANYWGSIFTHSLVDQYQFNSFVSDFNFIYNTYGAGGLDNILMTSDEEIRDYLLVRDAVTVQSVVLGSSLYISFLGEVPNNLKYYAMSLNINSNVNISGYDVSGTDDYLHTPAGTPQGLINVSWDGLDIPPPEQLADDYTTIAVNSGIQYDAWIAMDYVTTLDPGQHKDSLRHVLCNLDLIYDEGFCNFLTVDLGPDTTICEGNCVALSGPDDMATYEWIVADTLYSSDQSIVACPIDTTQYKLTVEDNFGNTASDSIMINVLPSVTVNIGNDTTLCSGQSLTLNGPTPPEGETYTYLWSTGENTQSITVMATVDTLFYLDVTNSYNCTSSDTIYIYVADLPVIDTITGDTAICPGKTITLEVQGSGILSYLWSTGDTTQSIQVTPPGSDTTYWYSVNVWSGFGCMAEDSIQIRVYPMAIVDFQHDTALVCQGDDVLLSVSASTSISTFTWIYNGTDSTTTVNELNLVRPSVSDFVYLTGQTNDGCLATDSIFLNILAVPELTITADTSICSGDSIVLTIAGGDLFFWAIAGDTISYESTLKVAPTDTTTYTAGSGFGESLCFADTNVTISILPAAATQILFDTAIVCEGTEIVLIGEGADTYLWMPSGDTSQQLLMTVRDTTWVFLTGTTDQGCSSTDSLELFTLPTPVVKLSGLFSAYCENDPAVTLIGQPTGGVYTGPGVSDDLFNPKEAGPGVHSVVYALTNEFECTGFDTVVTTVYGGNQPIDLGPADTLFPDEQKNLDAGEGFDSYYWSTGSNLRSITVFGVDFPHGTYEYRVIATISGCTSVGKVDITFINPDFIPESQSRTLLLYPNPNDGQFTFELPSANNAWNINIFSIYGKQVFSSLGDICQPDDCQFSLNLGSLPEGIYTIQLISGREVYTGKILIRK